MATHTNLQNLFTAIADSIRAKTGKAGTIVADTFPTEIAGIVTLPDTEQATPSITVSSAGLITASATQSAGYVAAGTKSATKQLTTQAAKTVTPSTSNQTAVASGVYTTGAVTVKGDANLIASNIASGKSIFGVTGTYTEAPVLLWTNASPTSVFGAQTVSIKGADYKAFLIEYRIGTSDANIYHRYVVKNASGKYLSEMASSPLNVYVTRQITAVSSTGIGFANATWAGNTYTQWLIPTRIWGIKFTL